MWFAASCLYDSCTLKETVPEEKGRRSCHSEILERTQRQEAVQSGESLFNISVCTKVRIQTQFALNLQMCSNSRSSWALRDCRHRFALANSSSSIRGSGRQPSCCRPEPEDTWPGRNGSAREMLWSSCRHRPGVCWQEKLSKRSKEM